MDRKAIARQTLDIMEKGWYETEGTVVEIRARQQGVSEEKRAFYAGTGGAAAGAI
ncbi:MAG: hypothetical protein ACLTW9_13495 [Enterocloster sp.]